MVNNWTSLIQQSEGKRKRFIGPHNPIWCSFFAAVDEESQPRELQKLFQSCPQGPVPNPPPFQGILTFLIIPYLTNVSQNRGFSAPVGITAINKSKKKITKNEITAIRFQSSLPPRYGIMGSNNIGNPKTSWMTTVITWSKNNEEEIQVSRYRYSVKCREENTLEKANRGKRMSSFKNRKFFKQALTKLYIWVLYFWAGPANLIQVQRTWRYNYSESTLKRLVRLAEI